MSKNLDRWKVCENLNLKQSILLIAGYDPSDYEGENSNKPFPPQYYPILTAIVHDIREYDVPAKAMHIRIRKAGGVDEKPWEFPDEPWNIKHHEFDELETRIDVSDLKEWLKKKKIKSKFFLPEIENSEAYADPDSEFYAPKLAAAVEAWSAIVQDQSLRIGKSPKQAIEKWLQENKERYELSNEAIEQISTVANWNQKGGAPVTPSRKKHIKK